MKRERKSIEDPQTCRTSSAGTNKGRYRLRFVLELITLFRYCEWNNIECWHFPGISSKCDDKETLTRGFTRLAIANKKISNIFHTFLSSSFSVCSMISTHGWECERDGVIPLYKTVRHTTTWAIRGNPALLIHWLWLNWIARYGEYE